MVKAAPKHYPQMTMVVLEDGGMYIECELTDPPSQAGRSVDVFFTAADVTELAIRATRVARGRMHPDVGTERRESLWRYP